MFLWIGCKLPEKFEKEIRAYCLDANQYIGLDTLAFSLPQHISLKISFHTEQAEEIVEDLVQFLSVQTPFSAKILRVEQAGNILWMPVEENALLRQLHESLDSRLESRFGVPQHEFDKCFKFHSTLFIDQDTQKIARMGTLLKDSPLPQEQRVDTFLLGVSETGKPGTYRIIRQIEV